MKRTMMLTLLVAVLLTGALQAKTIGIMWVGKSGMANRVYDGFMESISKLAPGMQFIEKRELPDMETGLQVYDQLLKECDGVVWLRSNGAQAMGKNLPNKPCFIGGTNNPEQLGAVSSLEGAPDKNITGVTYFIPPAQQLKIFKSVFPDAKTIGLILQEGHPGTAVDRKFTRKACQEMGLTYKETVCTSKDDIGPKVSALAAEVDLLIVGSEALLLDNMGIVMQNNQGKPVVGYSEKSVQGGALMGLVASDQKLGSMLAASVNDVINGGQPVSQVKIKTDPQPALHINKKTLQNLKVMIPPALMKNAKYVE